jgi:hypothetical protein
MNEGRSRNSYNRFRVSAPLEELRGSDRTHSFTGFSGEGMASTLQSTISQALNDKYPSTSRSPFKSDSKPGIGLPTPEKALPVPIPFKDKEKPPLQTRTVKYRAP